MTRRCAAAIEACLVPLTIDGSEPPLGFRQFQTIDLSRPGRKNQEAALDAMLRAVAALHDRRRRLAPVRLVRRPVDRRLVVGGGAAALAAAGAGAVWWSGMLGPGGANARSVARAAVRQSQRRSRPATISRTASPPRSAPSSRATPCSMSPRRPRRTGFATAMTTPAPISRQLRVGYLLDGNVRPTGAMVRVSAELIDGAHRLQPVVGLVRPADGRRLRGPGGDRAGRDQRADSASCRSERSAATPRPAAPPISPPTTPSCAARICSTRRSTKRATGPRSPISTPRSPPIRATLWRMPRARAR